MAIGLLAGIGSKVGGLFGSGKVKGFINKVKNRKANGGIFGGKIKGAIGRAFGGGGAPEDFDALASGAGGTTIPGKAPSKSPDDEKPWYIKYLWALIAGPIVLIGGVFLMLKGGKKSKKRGL